MIEYTVYYGMNLEKGYKKESFNTFGEAAEYYKYIKSDWKILESTTVTILKSGC